MRTPVGEESLWVMWRNVFEATRAHQPAGPASPCGAQPGRVGQQDSDRKSSLGPLQTQCDLKGGNAIQVLEDPRPAVSCRVRLVSHVTHWQGCREQTGAWLGEGAGPARLRYVTPCLAHRRVYIPESSRQGPLIRTSLDWEPPQGLYLPR